MRALFSFKFFRYSFYSWIVFLGGISIFAKRDPVFWDALFLTDVSSQYESQISLFRYLIEPLVGTTFSLFSRDMIWLGVATLIYFIFRSCWRLALRSPESIGIKKRVIMAYLRNVFSFHCISFFLIISSIVIFLLVMVQLRGMAFGTRYALIITLRGLYFSAFLFLIKFLLNFLSFFSSDQPPIKVKTLTKTKIWLFRFPKTVSQELFYYISFLSFLFVLNFSLISVPFPTQKIITHLKPNEYLFDFQVHTTYSDGYLTPEERVRWYIEQGIHGAAITDHNNGQTSLRTQEYVEKNELDFYVIRASEYTSNYPRHLHLNILGLGENIFPIDNKNDLDASISLGFKEMIRYVHEKGGWVSVNHYNGNVSYSKDELLSWGVDGFEIVNGYLSISEKKLRDYCIKHKLICFGGSDEHENRELNRFVRFRLASGVPLTTATIIAELSKNEHQVIRLDLYPKRLKFSKYPPKTVESVDVFLNYLLNLDRFQLLSWFIWSVIIYGIICGIVVKIQSMDEDEIAKKIVFIEK